MILLKILKQQKELTMNKAKEMNRKIPIHWLKWRGRKDKFSVQISNQIWNFLVIFSPEFPPHGDQIAVHLELSPILTSLTDIYSKEHGLTLKPKLADYSSQWGPLTGCWKPRHNWPRQITCLLLLHCGVQLKRTSCFQPAQTTAKKILIKF